MTAEIAIVNRQAIVLAADSALTIGRQRVWKNSNKLFSLGPTNDLAVMVWGGGEFVGYGWELIVKLFRSEICTTAEFATVEAAASAFIEFLSDHRLAPDQVNRETYPIVFLLPLAEINKLREPADGRNAERAAVISACEKYRERIKDENDLVGAPEFATFVEEHGSQLTSLANEIFDLHITKTMQTAIHRAIYSFYSKSVESDYETGVVVAGFGSSELFPNLVEYTVDGRDRHFTRSWKSKEPRINDDDSRKTFIIPFGQTDIFHLFMEGISHESLNFLEIFLKGALDDKSDRLIKEYVTDETERTVESAKQKRQNDRLVTGFLREFREYRSANVVQPVIDVVRVLPKEEMAEMAKALVELTSLRRKVDSGIESVGGPVDVMIISKSDGQIWIKRKHYFGLEINRDFMYRKQLKMGARNAQGNGHNDE